MNPLVPTTGALLLTLGAFSAPAVATAPGHAGAPTAPVRADYRPELIPADATMVVHLDLELLWTTHVGRYLLEHRAELGLEELDEARQQLGFDPLEATRSVTIYGSGEDTEPNMIVLVADRQAVDRALDELAQLEGFQTSRVEGVDLVGAEELHAHVHVLDDELSAIVVSDSQSAVVRGAQVLHGDVPSLDQAHNPRVTVRPTPGAFLFVSASELGAVRDFEPASQVFGLAQGIQFDVGEAGGSFFLRLSLATESIESARKVSQIAQGLLALISLAGGEELPPEVQDLLYGLQVNSRGSTVTLDFEYAVEPLLELLEALEDEH